MTRNGYKTRLDQAWRMLIAETGQTSDTKSTNDLIAPG